MTCYQGAILMVKDGDDLPPLPDFKVAHSKTCYHAVMKALTKTNPRSNWTGDGLKGADDPNTSMKILIDWFQTEGNYTRYRGKGNNGVTKMQFASLLASKMAKETTSKDRNAKQVMDKISQVEDSFKNAHDFATSQTGAGIQERDGETHFKELVKKRFSYYYELLDVMVDRAATEPKITNLNPASLDTSSSDDDDSDKEDREDRQEPVVVDQQQTTVSPLGDGAASARGSANNSVASSRKSNSKKDTRKRNNILMDDETVQMLSTAQNMSRQKTEEMHRHNRQIEAVERSKLELQKKQEEREDVRLNLERQRFESQQWKGKVDQLDYKVRLVKECQALKSQGLTKEQILTLFPEMKDVLEALDKNN
jgi:hypothetical protein